MTDPVTMVIMAIGGDIIPDEPRITLKPCDFWVERWGQSPRKKVQGHFWPICHAVKASPWWLQIEVWNDYPMIVVPRKDWKQCSPGIAVVPLPAVFVEEERDIWK